MKKGKVTLAELAPSYLSHLGLILSNLSVVITILAFLSMFTVLLPVFYWIALVAIVVFTLGTIFAINPNFGNYFTNGSEIMVGFFESVMAFAPTLSIIGLVAVVSSCVLLICDKRERHVGRIVASVFQAIILIFVFAMTKGGIA